MTLSPPFTLTFSEVRESPAERRLFLCLPCPSGPRKLDFTKNKRSQPWVDYLELKLSAGSAQHPSWDPSHRTPHAGSLRSGCQAHGSAVLQHPLTLLQGYHQGPLSLLPTGKEVVAVIYSPLETLGYLDFDSGWLCLLSQVFVQTQCRLCSELGFTGALIFPGVS